MKIRENLLLLVTVLIFSLAVMVVLAEEERKEGKQIEEKREEVMPERRRMMDEVISRHPRYKDVQEEIREIHLKIRELIQTYNKADAAEKEALVNEIKDKLLERFNMETEMHRSLIEEASERLEKLSENLEKRLENKEEIIGRQLERIFRGPVRREGEGRPYPRREESPDNTMRNRREERRPPAEEL